MRNIVVLTLLTAALGSAQSPVVREVTGLKPNPADAVRNFEPAANEPYTLGAGDELTIESIGRSELSGKHVVGPDGKITLPVAGPVAVAGLTRDDAAKSITKALSAYYAQPSVTVRVDKYASNRILLLGRVAKPGVLYFERTPTLLEAITQSGGLTSTSGPSDPLPSRCAIFRGREQVLWVDLKSMLNSGSAAVDMRLRRDDVVYVPDEQDQYVSVLGEVQHPGAFKLKPNLSITDVLAMSGGLTENAAPAKIRLIRPSTGVNREIAFNDLLNSSKSAEASLLEGDIVYVPKSGFAKVGYVIQKISPVSTMLLFGSSMAR